MHGFIIFLGDSQNIHATFQKSKMAPKKIIKFNNQTQAFEYFKNSNHDAAIIFTDKIAGQGEAYKILKSFKGEFFTLYAWDRGIKKRWVLRQVSVEWGIIKNFFNF